MKLIRGINNITAEHRPSVVTIGNFDGVHLGHQALLKRLKQQAQLLNLPATVIIFEPQPNEFFYSDNVPPRLMRLREKILILQQYQVDQVICLRFDEKLAALSAEDFIEKILIEKLAIRYLVIGDDFHFGKARRGNFTMLQNYAKANNFTVEAAPTLLINNKRASSTEVRHALQAGDLTTAKQLLGRPFMMSGRVAHGDKRGRIIGFPTANIYLHRKVVPLTGVFVVQVHGIETSPIAGVANVGVRPTFDGTRSLLEVHLFDFNQDIYGKHVNVEFLYKLRDEKKYSSFELLKQQIFQDAENARHYFLNKK